MSTLDAEPRLIRSPEAMVALGETIATALSDGAIVALIGDLGAGKTHLTKGIARGMGYQGEVTSPTFSLVHEYRGGRLPVFHFDFYRMDDIEEVLRIGWDEYLDEAGVIVAEWPNKFPELLPEETICIKIEHQGNDRLVSILRWE